VIFSGLPEYNSVVCKIYFVVVVVFECNNKIIFSHEQRISIKVLASGLSFLKFLFLTFFVFSLDEFFLLRIYVFYIFDNAIKIWTRRILHKAKIRGKSVLSFSCLDFGENLVF